uniref:Fibronectin type III domain containing 1 n=1 Tax=Paramormyrops kingsleyae TaxID=1676925 RepID=A0A3B3QLE7_9TELE|nr:fibronectin type III domain-containing protein 1 isoform X1 [Paramormyrops kingsleyae]
MSPATVRTLLCLLLSLIALILGVAGLRPLKPTNVKLTVIDEGLRVTWGPPDELDSRPVDWYNIGYGTAMKTLRFVKVDKDERSQVLEDVEPGVLHFLKMTAENADGMSKPVYKAETPKAKSQERRRPTEEIREKLDSPRNVALGSNRGYLLGLAQSDHRLLDKPRPLGRRSQRPHQLASESVYVVSLQAQNAPRQSSSAYSAVMTKKKLAEPEELPEAKDITVRVNSPQSVMVSWVDPATDRERSSDNSREWLYTVRYREKGESARWDYKETPQRRLLVDGLFADHMYEFSVRISEGLRHGPWSASVFQRTPESAPTGSPTNFHVKPLRGKGTAVTATWEPPEEPNGRLREYILTYAPALKPFGAKSITYPGSQTSASIDGLQPGDSYIFKIRAVNRRGQGPPTKAFSIAMPTTSAVASSQQTKSQENDRSSHLSSRTSKQSSKDSKDDGLQSTEETDEPAPYSPKTVNPMARRSRPLSQSRSYHSVFSSARSLVRNGASPLQDKRDQNNKDHTSHKESSDELEEDLDEEDTENRKQTVTQNNDKSSSKNPAYGSDTSPHDTSPSRSHATPVKPWPGSVPRVPFHTRIIPAANSQTDVGMESVKPRRLPTPTRKSTTHVASPERVDTSSPSSNNQDVSLSRKDYTANAHPDKKESLQITPNQETSSKLNQAPSIQTQGGNHHAGSGLVLSRRKPFGPMRNTSRVFHGQRKPVSSSAASQSTLPTGIQNPQSSSHALIKNDVKVEGNNQDYKDTEGVIKDERPTAASHASTLHSLSSPVSKDGKDGQESRTKEYNYGSYPFSRTNSSTSMGRGYRLGVSNRTLPRVSSSRDKSAPSVGANRPVLKETSSHSGISMPRQTSSDLLPSKHLSTSGASKPSLPNWSSVLSGSANSVKSPSSRGNTESSDSSTKKSGSENGNENSDNVHHGNKETSEKNYKITTTSAPQSATSAASKASRPQSNDNESIDRDSSPRKGSSTVPLLPRRPLVGPNGRFRSPLLQNRQLSLRLPTRLLPSQHTQSSGSISESSRLPSSSGTGTSSHVMSSQLPHSASRQTSSEGAGPSSVAKQSQPSDTSLRQPIQGTRLRYPSRMDISSRGKKNGNEQGKNGRPNLTVANGKDAPTSDNSNKPGGQRIITGPEGTKWIVDLNKGLLMNENGQILQDSEGRPHRVVLGEDGQTIFDSQGSPLVNQEGLALFGHGRDSRPVVNPKDKMLTLGGKPLIGLDRPKLRTTTVQTTTTELTTLPTTTEMTTVEPTMKLTVEPTTIAVHPTCPPGTYSKSDARGFPLLDMDGILNCYPEEGASGMDVDAVVTVPVSTHRPGTLAVVEEDFVMQTTLASTTAAPVIQSATKPLNSGPSSTFDAAGNERFTAPYVSYIRKDPGAPCSLTEALEYVQVDVLENLLAMDNQAHNLPPRNKPHNITVVAMEGCHSFVILDWARPLKDDMVSGYMVYSASYDDVLSNRWSSATSTGTHLPVENLKPNSRYYFKVQAKNIFGMGPISDTLTYVTESDDPLLIERPPGGEPIWIPFSFKYNTAQSTCKGSQFVKRTWYRKFVGVVLCNSLRYKIFMGEGLKDTFYSIGDTFGFGEDHCQFVDSYLEGRTGPHSLSEFLPTTQGFYRSYRQEPVRFGPIGQRTPHTFVGWYECGVPIPGKW